MTERSTDGSPHPTEVEQPTLSAHSVARNTVFALLVQLTTATFTAATSLYLIRSLGPAGFGVFALALGLGGISGLVARFGVPPSLARFLADNRHDTAACAALVRDALHVTLVTATLSAGVLFFTAGPIAAAYHQDNLVWPLRGMAISVIAETTLALYMSVFIALARITANLRIVFVESLVEASATIALVAGGAGATGAAFGRAIGYTVGAVLAAVLVLRLLWRISTEARSDRPRQTRQILRYAKPLFVLDTIYGLFSRVDVLLIGGLLTTASVGVFSAPKRLMPGIESISLAVANSVSPRQAPSEGGRYVDHFTASLRWLTILYGVLIAPFVVWADPIVALLFGSKYHGSANVLRLLTPYIFLNGISPLVATTVNYLGLARRRIPIAAGALAVNIAVDVLLLRRIGVVAAAIGTSAAFFLYVPAHLLLCRRQLGFSITPLIRTVIRTLAAAGAMSAVLALVGSTNISLVSAILGLLGAIVAYVGALLFMREITRHELIRGYRTLQRRVRRRGTKEVTGS